jgi:hypothetical protein
MICQMFSMIIKHANHILRGNRRGRGTYSSCYLSFVAGRRENGLLDLSDLALPLLLEAGEKLLELSHLLAFLRSSTACRCTSNALRCCSEISSKVTMMMFFGSISEDMSKEDRFG